MENVWLATVPLGMGIQFVSFPTEIPKNWEEIGRMLEVPDDLVLMAVYRLGYVPPPNQEKRNTIDWQSRQRKRIPQFVFRNTLTNPEPSPPDEGRSLPDVAGSPTAPRTKSHEDRPPDLGI